MNASPKRKSEVATWRENKALIDLLGLFFLKEARGGGQRSLTRQANHG